MVKPLQPQFTPVLVAPVLVAQIQSWHVPTPANASIGIGRMRTTFGETEAAAKLHFAAHPAPGPADDIQERAGPGRVQAAERHGDDLGAGCLQRTLEDVEARGPPGSHDQPRRDALPGDQ